FTGGSDEQPQDCASGAERLRGNGAERDRRRADQSHSRKPIQHHSNDDRQLLFFVTELLGVDKLPHPTPWEMTSERLTALPSGAIFDRTRDEVVFNCSGSQHDPTGLRFLSRLTLPRPPHPIPRP